MSNSTYVKDGKCIACGLQLDNAAAEADHIRNCPVNPSPGYIDRATEVTAGDKGVLDS